MKTGLKMDKLLKVASSFRFRGFFKMPLLACTHANGCWVATTIADENRSTVSARGGYSAFRFLHFSCKTCLHLNLQSIIISPEGRSG